TIRPTAVAVATKACRGTSNPSIATDRMPPWLPTSPPRKPDTAPATHPTQPRNRLGPDPDRQHRGQQAADPEPAHRGDGPGHAPYDGQQQRQPSPVGEHHVVVNWERS